MTASFLRLECLSKIRRMGFLYRYITLIGSLLWGKNWISQRKTCHSKSIFYTVIMWTALGLNSDLWSEKPTCNCIMPQSKLNKQWIWVPYYHEYQSVWPCVSLCLNSRSTGSLAASQTAKPNLQWLQRMLRWVLYRLLMKPCVVRSEPWHRCSFMLVIWCVFTNTTYR